MGVSEFSLKGIRLRIKEGVFFLLLFLQIYYYGLASHIDRSVIKQW